MNSVEISSNISPSCYDHGHRQSLILMISIRFLGCCILFALENESDTFAKSHSDLPASLDDGGEHDNGYERGYGAMGHLQCHLAIESCFLSWSYKRSKCSNMSQNVNKEFFGLVNTGF